MWGACSCDRESCFGPPEFTSGTHAVARRWSSGQLSAVMASGSYRPGAVDRSVALNRRQYVDGASNGRLIDGFMGAVQV